MQLLLGLVGEQSGSVLDGPAVGDEFSEPGHGPAGLEFVEHVDEVVAGAEAQQAAGLHERVGAGEPFGGLRGAREKVGLSAHARLAQDALGMAVVDLEATVGEAPAHVGALVLGIAESLAEGRFGQTLGNEVVDPRVENVEQGQRPVGPQLQALLRGEPLGLGDALDVIDGTDELDAARCALVAQLERLVKPPSYVCLMRSST